MTIPTPSAEPEDVIEELINFHEVRAEDIRFFFRDRMTPEPFPGANDGMRKALAMHTDGVAALRRLLERERGLREALRLLMAEVVADPKRLPYPIWGPGQSQRVSVALIAANTALSNPLKTET